MNFILFYYFSLKIVFSSLHPIESYVRCWSLILALPLLLFHFWLPNLCDFQLRINQLTIIELVSHSNRTDWTENGRSTTSARERDECFAKSELCTSAYWYVHYCEYLKRFLRLSTLELHFGKPTLCNRIAQTTLRLSLCLLCSTLSKFKLCIFIKTFSLGKWEKCTYRTKENC